MADRPSIAPPPEVVAADRDAGPGAEPKREKVRSLGSDAWESLRRRPLFWVSATLIVIMVTMAVFPQLFTFFSPNPDPFVADQSTIRQPPGPDAWFGRDNHGFDVYARTIYGARASILVGLLASLATVLLSGVVGLFAGFHGHATDAILSRVGDIFFAIPLLLGGILILYTFPSDFTTPYFLVIGKIVLALAIIGWPRIARIMRASVLQVKPQDYVQAARALGASPARIITGHVLPNAFAPVVVVATIDLGVFIATEATLAFIMLGDAIRDAFDPKSR